MALGELGQCGALGAHATVAVRELATLVDSEGSGWQVRAAAAMALSKFGEHAVPGIPALVTESARACSCFSSKEVQKNMGILAGNCSLLHPHFYLRNIKKCVTHPIYCQQVSSPICYQLSWLLLGQAAPRR